MLTLFFGQGTFASRVIAFFCTVLVATHVAHLGVHE